MKFKEALKLAQKQDNHTHADLFLLYSRVCDLVGNDYEAKKAAEEFYHLDAKYEISKAILDTVPQPKRRKRKKHTYKIKPIAPPPDNAYVFYTSDAPTFHVSGECPCLQSKTVFRATYDFARRVDYLEHLSKPLPEPRLARHLAKTHTPQICRRCGHFSPSYPKTLIERLQALLYYTLGIGSPI